MNLEKNPTVEELRDLLRKCDDQAGHHVLWVAKNGDVHVSRVPKDETPVGFQEAVPEMQLRYETFEAGNEYVGPDAAEDEGWVKQLFDALVREWPEARGKPIVDYVDQF
jgi:hypothetical protein